MHTISKKEFTKLKQDLREWLPSAFEENENSFYRDGALWKENEKTFDYPGDCITLSISAVCDPDTGQPKKAYFDDIVIIDDENETYVSSQIDEYQTNELNLIIKHYESIN